MALALTSSHTKKKSTRNMGGEQSSARYSPCGLRSKNHEQTPEPCDVIAIVKSCRKDKFRGLIQALVYSDGNVNTTGEHGMTALHYAVLNEDELIIKTLVVFGAHCNARNEFRQTPLDMAIENRKDNVVPLLVSVGCKQGCIVESTSSSSLYYGISPEEKGKDPCNDINPVVDGLKRAKHVLSDQIEDHMRSRLIGSTSIRPDEAYAYLLQQRELQKFKTDNGERCSTPFDHDLTPPPMEFASQGGARILSLDGGGMRGLIQLEILFEIEKMTGKRIVELFDWIIGNSIGGIMALGLVYADMTIAQLRRMYFRLKDKVFSSKKGFGGYNTKVLEELLQEVLGTEQRMCDRRHPKVLITAVDKSNTPMNIHYFNNCFDDQFSTRMFQPIVLKHAEPVWKVARYSSAAPLYFSELDDYVDGGVMANNPCGGGLAKIQSFYQAKNERMPISCMVSVGSGLFPPSKLGKISIFGVQNLFRMLGDALGQSEAIADQCKTSCEAQGIPFYRFSPPLDEKIQPTETNSRKLVDIMIISRMYMHGMEDYKSDRLLPLLLQVTGTS